MSKPKYLYRIEHAHLGLGIFRFHGALSGMQATNPLDKVVWREQCNFAEKVKDLISTNHPCIEDDVIEDFSGFLGITSLSSGKYEGNVKCILSQSMRFEDSIWYSDVDEFAAEYMRNKYGNEGGLCAMWKISEISGWLGDQLLSRKGLYFMMKAGLVLKRIKMKPEAEVLYTNTQAVYFKSEVESEEIIDYRSICRLFRKFETVEVM